MNIRIYFDGAHNNRNKESSGMGIGIAVFFNDQYDEELSRAIYVKYENRINSSNVAEWIGCVEAMKLAAALRKNNPNNNLSIYSDSQCVSYQFNGTYAINSSHFIPYYKEAQKYAQQANIKTINWIPREKNKEADKLSKEGLNLKLAV